MCYSMLIHEESLDFPPGITRARNSWNFACKTSTRAFAVLVCLGNVVLGRFHGKPVVVLQGRAHPYEGHRHWQSALYVWVLRELGVRVLVLTNAAGGLNPAYRVGQLVLVKDQLDLPTFAGMNALYGMRDTRLFGQRFVPMRAAYDLELRRLALTCARDLWGESALTLEGGPEGPGLVQVRRRSFPPTRSPFYVLPI